MNMAERHAGESRGILRGFADIGIGTTVSRLSGFAREVLTATIFGAGTAMDIFVAAFTIPNLLCRVLGEGAVESAFMPLFKARHARGERERAWRLASETTSNLALILLVLVGIGAAAGPLLVGVVARGFEGEVAQATIRMTRLMFPFGLLIGLAALMGSILLAFGRYRVYSLAPVLLNVGIIAGVVLFWRSLGFYSLAVGVLLGGFLQFLVQMLFVIRLARRDGARLGGAGLGLADDDMRRVGRLAGPVVVASVLQRVGVVVDRAIASFLVPGSISALYYSFRLVHLPYAILALAAGRSVAPLLAEHHALGKHDDFRAALLSGLRMNFAYLAPVVCLAVWFAPAIVGLVYQRGAFDGADLAMTASAFICYSLGLVSMGMVFLLTRAFAARLDTKTPVRISVFALFLNVALNLILVRTPLRHAGLALASSLSFTAHAFILYVIMNRALGESGTPLSPRDLMSSAGKALLACGALLAVAWAVDSWVGMAFACHTTSGRLARVALGGTSALSAYLLAARLVGLEEVTLLFARARRPK